jgi:hypothetical protein
MEFHYLSSAPFWVLFFISPLTPFLNNINSTPSFQWKSNNQKSIQ